MGAPSGRRNRFTSTKSLSRAFTTGVSFDDVLVVSLDQQGVDRDGARALRLRPGAVILLPAHDVQVGAGNPAAQHAGVQDEVVSSRDAHGLAPAQPALASRRTMNRSRAERQARSSARTSSSLARPTGSSVRRRGAGLWRSSGVASLAAGLDRQVTVVGDLVELGQHKRRHRAERRGMAQELADAGQHGVDPARPAKRFTPGPATTGLPSPVECRNQNMKLPSRPAAVVQSRPVQRHHVR